MFLTGSVGLRPPRAAGVKEIPFGGLILTCLPLFKSGHFHPSPTYAPLCRRAFVAVRRPPGQSIAAACGPLPAGLRGCRRAFAVACRRRAAVLCLCHAVPADGVGGG